MNRKTEEVKHPRPIRQSAYCEFPLESNKQSRKTLLVSKHKYLGQTRGPKIRTAFSGAMLSCFVNNGRSSGESLFMHTDVILFIKEAVLGGVIRGGQLLMEVRWGKFFAKN